MIFGLLAMLGQAARAVCPNIAENFVKLYAELQKLDHLTCSKLKI